MRKRSVGINVRVTTTKKKKAINHVLKGIEKFENEQNFAIMKLQIFENEGVVKEKQKG